MGLPPIIKTVFLDAGGVLVWPNWTRVCQALHAHGVTVEPQRLAAADPLARFSLDRAEVIAGTTDEKRGSTYFDLVLKHAGVPLSQTTAAAFESLGDYH